jgi:multidrug efflux pump subunit AcrA (membrane-fusion protein)
MKWETPVVGHALAVIAMLAAAGCWSGGEPPAATPSASPAKGSAPAPVAATAKPVATPTKPAADHFDEGAAPHAHEEGAEPEAHDEAAGPVVPLSTIERENIGLKTEPVTRRPIEDVRRFPGVIKPHPDRVALVTSRTSGRIVNIHAKLGERVRKGQDLIEVQSVEVEKLEIDLIQAESRYRTERSKLEFELAQAENRLRLAQADADRNRVLVEKGIGARKELIAAENQLQSVLNEIARAKRDLELLAQASQNETEGLIRQLTLLGLPRDAIERVRREQNPTRLHIPASLGGLIVERPVSLGQIIEPTTTLFRITDDSAVIADGDVFEDVLSLLRVGQSVRLKVTAFPKRVFEGTLTFIDPVIDPQKRTVHVWAQVPNQDRLLKQDMFAELNVVVGGGRPVLAVPVAAVVAAEGSEFVFVEREGGFGRVEIATGARNDQFVEAKHGLKAGDRVVTDGNRQVYTKLLTMRSGGAAIGGHTH